MKKIPAAVSLLLLTAFVPAALLAAEMVLFNDDQVFLEIKNELRARYYEVYKTVDVENTPENFLVAPTAMAFDQKNNRLLIGDHLAGKIYSFSTDNFLRSSDFGVNFSGERLFGKITDIFISPRNDFAVSDGLLHKVTLFNQFGVPVQSFGRLGETFRDFNEPSGIAAIGANLYIADRYNCRVCVYDLSGNYRYSFGSRGSSSGQLYLPTALATNGAGELLVCDSGNDRIQIFDTMGVSLRTIGRRGRHEGEFNNPTDVCVDALNNIYVADYLNARVQKFDEAGRFMCQVSSLDSSFFADMYKPVFYFKMPKNLESNEVSVHMGSLMSPYKIKVDNRKARLYVLDRERKAVYFFDSENFAKGRALYIAGDYLNSIKYLQEAVVQTGSNVNAMFYLGFSYNEIGKAREAYGCYKEIIDKFPRTEVAKYARYYMKRIIAANDAKAYLRPSEKKAEEEKISETLTKRFMSGETEELTIFERKAREFNKAKAARRHGPAGGAAEATAELELKNIGAGGRNDTKAEKYEKNPSGR